MQELADVVAAGTCVWFAGAGLSLEAGMPKVIQLTMALLDNAFVRRIGRLSIHHAVGAGISRDARLETPAASLRRHACRKMALEFCVY
ncbi:MAG TPA: hypothetical protein VK464_19735 [Symbiobacteriaceae bacterium]|nr:hypothetical protein [Symbiobacteriaceae bacterium]